MKIIQFNSDELVPALALVNSVVLSKNALPILNDVRIETKNDGQGGVITELMASDGETWLQCKKSITEADAGIVVCIEAKSLLQALRNLGGKFVTMEINEDNHIVTCMYDNGKFSLPYEEPNEFPMPMATIDNGKEKRIDGKKILTAIERAGYATANDELRPVMNGVRFEFFADGMVAVASDGHKLSKYKDLTVNYDDSEDQTIYGFIMPKKPCNTLMNVLANTIAGDVKLVFNDRCFTVNNTQFKLTARLIEGRYPNYDSVIPKTNDKIINVDKAAFISAVKRVLPMGNTNSELVSLTFADGMMTIAAEDFDFSKSASENVPCDYPHTNAPMSIGFKGSILLQLLQNVEGDTVKISLADPTRAALITEGTANNVYEYTSLLMPMLLAN